jgi:hypothetical protein
MNAPPQGYYSKPETEVWIAFDCREREVTKRLHRERRAWGSCVTVESLGYGRAVLVVPPGGAWELAR